MKKSNPIVSIIMPVYKVEEYVGKAIESLQEQTLKDWELWAVDDGSPDRSGAICEEYASNDKRIHILHKENGGAPSARNAAIKHATGKYFYFMDSDDWTEPDMLEDMVRIADQQSAQLVVAGFYIDTYYTDSSYYREVHSQPTDNFRTQKDFRENAYRLFDTNLLYTPWNKLYKAAYIRENRITFPQMLWDDFAFNLKVISNVEKVCVTNKAYYHFIRKRAESETAKYNPKMYEKREEEHRWMQQLYEFWGLSDSKSSEMIARRYIERLIGCIENLTNPQCELPVKQKKQQISQMISSQPCRAALQKAKPRSAMMKFMLLPIQWKWTWLTYLEGLVISAFKRNYIKTFARLKASR